MPVDITLVKGAVIVTAGLASGFINAIVGSGSLISFPLIVGQGFATLPANIANNIGQFPGSISAVYGYRKELVGQQLRIRKLVPASFVGSAVGAFLLLRYPKSFKQVVPFLVLLGVALVLLAPGVQARVKARQAASGTVRHPDHLNMMTIFVIMLTGIYGGYFGAGQGVVLVGVLGMALSDELVRINALKNVLVTIVNGIAAVIFVVRGDVPWAAAGLVAVGAIVGAQIGARIGRRIPPNVLRGIIAVIGVVAALKLWHVLPGFN